MGLRGPDSLKRCFAGQPDRVELRLLAEALHRQRLIDAGALPSSVSMMASVQ